MTAALRIIIRVNRLTIALANLIEVYVSYYNSTLTCHYVDDTHISFLLREVAKTIYNITSKVYLNRFTVHSTQIGASVLLRVNGIM